MEKGKYAVDGGVVPLEGKFYHGSQRQFEIDYSKCKTLSPYHPSRDDISFLVAKEREIGVDVFHVFWHPQDLWRPHDAWYPQEADKPKKIDHSLLECAGNLLRMASELEDIVFSMAYKAAMNWDESR